MGENVPQAGFYTADTNRDGVVDRDEFRDYYTNELSQGLEKMEPLDPDINYVEIYGLEGEDKELTEINDAMFAKHFPQAHRKMLLHK